MALSSAGLDVTIYERSDSLEEFGAGLQLTPNATRVLSRLGALQAVRAAATSSSAICVVRGSDDHVLTRMPLENAEHRWGAPYLTIHRADLQRTLAEAVFRQRNVELKLGSTVLEAANHGDRVVVGLECGLATSQDFADLLIAADGLRSRLRERSRLRHADELLFTGWIAFRTAVNSNLVDPRWRGDEVCLRIGPNAHLVHYPLRAKSVLNIVAVIKSVWRGTTDDRPGRRRGQQDARSRFRQVVENHSRTSCRCKHLASMADFCASSAFVLFTGARRIRRRRSSPDDFLSCARRWTSNRGRGCAGTNFFQAPEYRRGVTRVFPRAGCTRNSSPARGPEAGTDLSPERSDGLRSRYGDQTARAPTSEWPL